MSWTSIRLGKETRPGISLCALHISHRRRFRVTRSLLQPMPHDLHLPATLPRPALKRRRFETCPLRNDPKHLLLVIFIAIYIARVFRHDVERRINVYFQGGFSDQGITRGTVRLFVKFEFAKQMSSSKKGTCLAPRQP